MSTMGQRIREQRLALGLAPKAVAKAAGLSEKQLIDIELGKRVLSDQLTRQIFKAMGVTESEELSTASMYEQADSEKEAPRPRPAAPPKNAPIASTADEEMPSGALMQALSSKLFQRVPVRDETGKEIAKKAVVLEEGAVQAGGASVSAERMFYFKVPDAAMSGARLLGGDLVLIAPTQVLCAGKLMLLECGGKLMIRLVQPLDHQTLSATALGQVPNMQRLSLSQTRVLGLCVRLEATL